MELECFLKNEGELDVYGLMPLAHSDIAGGKVNARGITAGFCSNGRAAVIDHALAEDDLFCVGGGSMLVDGGGE